MNVGPISGDNNTVGSNNNSNNVVVVSQSRGVGFFTAFLLFVLVVGIVKWITGLLTQVAVPLLLITAVGMVCWAIHRDLEEKAQRKAELAARADAENAAYQAGDYRGIFGQFPPDQRAQ